jgi:hypothetical protein
MAGTLTDEGGSGPKVVSGPDGGGATVMDDGKESVDVMEETKGAAAEAVMDAVKAGDAGALKTALAEFVYACK